MKLLSMWVWTSSSLSSEPDVLYGARRRRDRSEGRRGTDALRQQSCGIIARGVDLSVGMQEYSERSRFSFATGLGSEVLTFLFVVWCPRDHAKRRCNKAIKLHLFKLPIACGLVGACRRVMHASALVCSARRKRRLDDVQDFYGMVALICHGGDKLRQGAQPTRSGVHRRALPLGA